MSTESTTPEEAPPNRVLGLIFSLAFIIFPTLMLTDSVKRELEAFQFDRAPHAYATGTFTHRTPPKRRDAATLTYVYEATDATGKVARYTSTQKVSNALYHRYESTDSVRVTYRVDAPQIADLRESKSALRWGSEEFAASWLLHGVLALALAGGLSGLWVLLKDLRRQGA